MSKFNSIKKSRKKSEDIDEKIEYLDRELGKNGLREGMVTSKIYQGSTKVPNQDVSDFVAALQGGYPLGLSAADGNHLGNATLGLVSGHPNVALAPPHPVSGVRRSARHITSGLGNSTPLRPGETTTIGFGDNPPTRAMGSALWFFDPNHDSGAGQWNNLEWGVEQGAWGFWDTVKTGQFTGLYFFNTNLSQHPSGDISNKITGINFDANGAIGTPETTVLTQNDLGDPGFLPIDIPLSKQAFDYLLDKTGQYNYDEDDFRNLPPEELANIFSDPESEEAQKAAVNIVSNEIKENKPETASKMEQIGKAGETFINYVAGTLPETIDNDFLGEKYVNSLISGWDVTRNYDADGKDTGTWNFGDNILGTTQPPIRQGNTITVDFNYDFKNNYQELYGEDSAEMNPILKGLGFLVHSALGAYSKDAQPAFGLGPVDPLLGAVFSAFISLGKGLGGAQHTPGKLTLDLSQIAKLNPQLLRDVWNKGLITEEEFLKLSKGESLPEYDPTSEENFEYNKPSWFTFSYRTDDGRIFGYNFSGAFGELKLGPGGGERGSMESGYGTKGYDFRTNSGGTSWTMDYDGTSMWDKPGTSKPKSDPKPKPKPYKPTPQGGRGGGQGNPTNRRGSGAREDVHYKSDGELLFEATGLGHFDPEVLNVDINDIRKGIMPEFPKDPPPDMINGYSAKSKLAPKTIEGEPFIKITKKDLAKNHRLKDSEIKDFMKQIDAINNYIKQNPAELKYAMIRYPKDDPRLAQLNFKLDQMREASDEYMETHFPENESLFKKIQNKIKDNIEKTDPRRIDTSVPLVSEEEARIAKERRLNVLERYKKQVDVKPFFNKKTPEIDWKIDYLNKELAKNGLDEAMRTSTVYQGSKEIPNPTYSNFNAASFNGKTLGHSGADGKGNGGAYTGKVIASEHGLDPVAHSSILGLEGVAVSPPHPVSGKRRYASTRTGMVSFSPTQPGKIQGNSEYPTGSVMWLWNPNANNSDGTSGNWYPLEFDVSQQLWGFWDSNFLGFGFLNTNLSQLELPGGGNVGATVTSLINSIGITNKNNIGTPETIVLTQNNLDDPSFMPIDIGGLSNQGYEYLKSKAKTTASSGVNYDLSNWINKTYGGAASNWYENNPSLPHQSNPHIPPAEAPYVPLASADDVKIASTDLSAAFPSAPSVPPDPSDAPSVSVDSTEDAKPNVKDAKLGTWMSRQDFVQTYPNSTMVDYLNSLPYQASDFMTPNPNFPNAWDQNFKGYENYFMNGDLSALGNREGKPEPRNANTTVVPPRTVAPVSASKPTGFLDTILSAGADAVGRGAAKDVFDYYMDKVEKGHNGGEHNINNLLGRSKNAIERWYARNKTNIVTAREGGKSIFHDAAEQDFMHLSQKDGNLKNITGNLDLERGDGIFDKGDTLEIIKHYDFDGERDLAGGGVIGNLGSKGYAKSKGIMKYLGDDGTKTSPLMKLVITIDQKTGTVKTSVKESLDESVKLGHFEPEALTVDLEKLRKGILPEFPKDPPPKLINGYSEKSKLLPKTIEGEPFIKVDKKVLAKNHRLKDSEIKEFMDEINMINEYIKQNPAELIHAMQRYPKHDPRLAQLNWQMDQKMKASDEYMETHFPENQRLFNKLQTKIKQNIDLTNPDKFKNHKEAPKFVQNDIFEQQRRKEIVIRHFKKKKKKRK